MSANGPESSKASSVSLAGILDADADEDIKFPDQHEEAAGWDEAEGVSVAKEGFCVECEGVCVCDISLWDIL